MKLMIFLIKNSEEMIKHTNTIRIKLKKEEETFSDNTEDLCLIYAWLKWKLHKAIYKIEDLFRKKSQINDRHTNTIRIQLKKDMEIYYFNYEALHLTYGW